MPSGSSSGWLERDVVSEGLELGDEALGVAFGVAALEVVAAEVAVGLAGAEHVPVGDEHGVLDRAERASMADPGLETLVLGGQVGVFGADGGERGFFERDPEELAALAGAPGATFAGGLVVAGAASGPGGEVARAGKDAHVGADLSDHDLGGALGDAGHRGGQRDAGLPGRAQLGLDRVREPLDLLVQE